MSAADNSVQATGEGSGTLDGYEQGVLTRSSSATGAGSSLYLGGLLAPSLRETGDIILWSRRMSLFCPGVFDNPGVEVRIVDWGKVQG